MTDLDETLPVGRSAPSPTATQYPKHQATVYPPPQAGEIAAKHDYSTKLPVPQKREDERKFDPESQRVLTFKEMSVKYKSKLTPAELKRYWEIVMEECEFGPDGMRVNPRPDDTKTGEAKSGIDANSQGANIGKNFGFHTKVPGGGQFGQTQFGQGFGANQFGYGGHGGFGDPYLGGVSQQELIVAPPLEEQQGWQKYTGNREEQNFLAHYYLKTICQAVDARWMRKYPDGSSVLPDRRWTNDSEVFPKLSLDGTTMSNGVTDFPPHDQQYFVCGIYDPNKSKLRGTAVPSHMKDEDGNSTWMRLVDFAPNDMACDVFDESIPATKHYGRIVQGPLDNGYFVEALQAVSLRPKLARQLFYCYDVRRSVYMARIFKHGQWIRVDMDDYVPIGEPGNYDRACNAPIGCRSESFPYVMWPTLIEKAYAKVHTLRNDSSEASALDRGGWETLGGGGCAEEALADLTGGVAGRFRTADIDADRLFIYIYELQRDTLFLCRPNEPNCEFHGVSLNPYYPNVVNRAAVFEGRCFIQVYCGAPGLYDGGLQDHDVPWGLINNDLYPETGADGFFWCTAYDFRQYFDTIIECRLTNSGDVSLINMPPPRNHLSHGMIGAMSPNAIIPGMAPGMTPDSAGSGIPWYETVWFNLGAITRHNEPEFTVTVPENACPCEVVCSVEQIDSRLTQTTPERTPQAAVLAKVYENVNIGAGNQKYYSIDMVTKSNWFACRDSMVAFCARKGGEYRIVAELPSASTTLEPLHGNAQFPSMIFRCYSNRANVAVSAQPAMNDHPLVMTQDPPKALRWTFVGFVRRERYERGEVPIDQPETLVNYIGIETVGMRKPEDDLHIDPYAQGCTQS